MGDPKHSRSIHCNFEFTSLHRNSLEEKIPLTMDTKKSPKETLRSGKFNVTWDFRTPEIVLVCDGCEVAYKARKDAREGKTRRRTTGRKSRVSARASASRFSIISEPQVHDLASDNELSANGYHPLLSAPGSPKGIIVHEEDHKDFMRRILQSDTFLSTSASRSREEHKSCRRRASLKSDLELCSERISTEGNVNTGISGGPCETLYRGRLTSEREVLMMLNSLDNYG